MEKKTFAEIFKEAQEAAIGAYRQTAHLESEIMAYGGCGFAWVQVFVDGRSRAAKEMIQFGLRSDYMGGYNFWSSHIAPEINSQSVVRKEVACQAFAEVLKENGINALASSRLD